LVLKLATTKILGWWGDKRIIYGGKLIRLAILNTITNGLQNIGKINHILQKWIKVW